jgi:hypothetical protein
MSTYVDPGSAALWLDGDAFRGPAGYDPPTDPFASQPQLIIATVATNMDAFGGIEAGFTVTPSQDTKDYTVWNDKSGAAYATDKKPPTTSIKFRPVDYSKATALTILAGGSISGSASPFEWVQGEDEEFSILIRVVSGTKQQAYYCERATLASPPPQTMDDSDLAGWDIEIKPLAPASGHDAVRKFTNFNPLA